MKRKRYSEEFKSEAVSLVRSGMSCLQVEKDLGITNGLVAKWLKAANRPKDEIEKDKRIRELEKENIKLKREREILKKAAAYFAKEQL